MSTRELAQRAIVLAVVAKELAKTDQQVRADLNEALANADRVNVLDPDDPDTKLGTAWKTEPKASARVPDEHALLAWFKAHYPDRVDTHLTIDPARMEDAIVHLHEHFPEVLSHVQTVAPWARDEVLKLTIKAREPVGPEGELDALAPPVEYIPPKAGVVTVKPSEDAPDVVRRLWAQGRIDLTKGTVRAIGGAE